MNLFSRYLTSAALLGGFSISSYAQLLNVPQAAAAIPEAVTTVKQVTDEVDVQADQLEYKADSETMIARGNVLIRKGEKILTADLVTYNTRTEDAYARGNVVYQDLTQEWEGDELTYNFITGVGSFPTSTLKYSIFQIGSTILERKNDNHLHLEGVTLTTCDSLENPEFKVLATSADVYEETIVRVRNAVFYLRGVPFFYLPRYTLDMEREETNVDLIPGYSSRDGFFLLTGYNRYPSEGYRTKTRADFRQERGIAVGHDWVWFDPETEHDTSYIRTYYAADSAPYRNDAQEALFRTNGIDVAESRYRVKLFHTQEFTENDSLRVRASYLSDSRVVQDFFNEDFRESPIPENRATYSYIGDDFSAGIEVNKQINTEFYGGVSKLPEAYWDIPLSRIAESPFLYEARNQVGFLERTYSDYEREVRGFEEYDSSRIHTEQRLYYPTRQMGWLNITPRAGVVYTQYGNTLTQTSRVSVVESVDTNGVISTSFQTNNVNVAAGSDARILPEIGVGTSFKAFKELHNGRTSLGRGLRHVVEPFADYIYIPEPDLERSQIYQFDRIDQLGEGHGISFGVRNKWQTRQQLDEDRMRIHDYVDMTIRGFYDMRSDVTEPLSDIRTDIDFQPNEYTRLETTIDYDTELSEISRINTEFRIRSPETGSYLALDQLYRPDVYSVWQANYSLNPEGTFGLDGYTRYEMEEGGLEEQQVLLRYKTDCVGYGLGVRWLAADDHSAGEDDIRIWAQFWLLAMPGIAVDMGGR